MEEEDESEPGVSCSFHCSHCQSTIPIEDTKHPIFLRDPLPKFGLDQEQGPLESDNDLEMENPRIIDVMHTILRFQSSVTARGQECQDQDQESFHESLSLCNPCLQSLDNIYTAFKVFMELAKDVDSYILKNSSVFTDNSSTLRLGARQQQQLDIDESEVVPGSTQALSRSQSLFYDYEEAEPMIPGSSENNLEEEIDIKPFENVMDDSSPFYESETIAMSCIYDEGSTGKSCSIYTQFEGCGQNSYEIYYSRGYFNLKLHTQGDHSVIDSSSIILCFRIILYLK